MKKNSSQTPDVAALLKAGQWNKIEKLFASLAGGKNKSPNYFDLFALYAEVNNHMNRNYIKQMQEMMRVMTKMHDTEAMIDKHVKIASVKDKIKKMKK